MNESQSKSTSYGLTFLEALTLVFIVLKLTNKINWSWWWVLSPVWLSAVVVIVIIAAIVYLNIRPFKSKRKYQDKE